MNNRSFKFKRKIIQTSLIIGSAEFLSGTNYLYIPILIYVASLIFSLKLHFHKKTVHRQLVTYFIIEVIICSISFIEIEQNKKSKIEELFNIVKTYKNYYQLLNTLEYETKQAHEMNIRNKLPTQSQFRFEGDFFSCRLFCLSGVNISLINFLSDIEVKNKCQTEKLCFKGQVTKATSLLMTYDHELGYLYSGFPEINSVEGINQEFIVRFRMPVQTQDKADIPIFLKKDYLSMNDCVHVVQNFISNPLYHLNQEKIPVVVKVNTSTILEFKNSKGDQVGCRFKYNSNETTISVLSNKI